MDPSLLSIKSLRNSVNKQKNALKSVTSLKSERAGGYLV